MTDEQLSTVTPHSPSVVRTYPYIFFITLEQKYESAPFVHEISSSSSSSSYCCQAVSPSSITHLTRITRCGLRHWRRRRPRAPKNSSGVLLTPPQTVVYAILVSAIGATRPCLRPDGLALRAGPRRLAKPACSIIFVPLLASIPLTRASAGLIK